MGTYSDSHPFKRGIFLLCIAWMVVAVGSLVMVMIVWVIIMGEDIHIFQTTMHHYLGNSEIKYPPGDRWNGYVDCTNIPKHLGGIVFTSIFDISIMIFCLISMAADLSWWVGWAKKLLEWCCVPALYDDADVTKFELFFLWANAFLKLFIVAATGSQAWTGLYPNNPQDRTPTFCLYATFILLGSILPSFCVEATLVLRKKQVEWAAASKKAEEGKK